MSAGTQEALRVLIVDDDEQNADAMQQYLAFHSHRAESAGSAEEALLKIDGMGEPGGGSSDYQVIIIDLNLPGMRGEELAQRLRRRYANQLRLIGISGDHGVPGVVGPFDVRLPKPCPPRILLQNLQP